MNKGIRGRSKLDWDEVYERLELDESIEIRRLERCWENRLGSCDVTLYTYLGYST